MTGEAGDGDATVGVADLADCIGDVGRRSQRELGFERRPRAAVANPRKRDRRRARDRRAAIVEKIGERVAVRPIFNTVFC